MIIPMYCVMMFQIITFWEDYEPIHLTMKEDSVKYVLKASDELTYISLKYGHEVQTWGASLRKPVEVPASDLLEQLGYFIHFDGDGSSCR